MESLNTYCFPPIFSYLPLADLLNLRQVSRRLKEEVDDYMPNVRSLPLYLTTPRTPEEIAQYELIFHPPKSGGKRDRYQLDLKFPNESRQEYVRKLSFGTSGLETFEDKTILQNQRHFRLADFLILNHSSALPKFLKFMKKRCPNIQKLALVIDNCEHYLPEVSKILKAFPGIKVLLVENTLQDSCRDYLRQGDFDKLSKYIQHKYTTDELKVPGLVYQSILKLTSLEELFFFPKQYSTLEIHGRPGSSEANFLSLLAARLKVFHFRNNEESRWYRSRTIRRAVSQANRIIDVFDSPLQELACEDDRWLIVNDRLNLPRLKKFTMLASIHTLRLTRFEPLPRPELKVLEFEKMFYLEAATIKNLNSFTGLESIHCIGFVNTFNDDEIIGGDLKNWTVKHLRMTFYSSRDHWRKDRELDIRQLNKFFMALETCIVLEPEYLEIKF